MSESEDKLRCLSGVSNLKAPGVDPNYLYWEFKMELALESLGLASVLVPTTTSASTEAWAMANMKACTLITWAVDDFNIQYIKTYRRDAAGMWLFHCQEHKNSLLGG